MFLEKFEVGKRYRFNKELFKLTFGDSVSGWEDDIHLHEVITLDDRYGYAGDYLISPEWCEEIVVAESLKTRDDIKDMYKQVLCLEELEELLHDTKEAMIDGQFKYNFIEFVDCEIERIKQELGLEE